MRESSHVATTDPPGLPGGWIPLLGSQCSLGLSEALPSIPWKGTSHMSEIVWEGANLQSSIFNPTTLKFFFKKNYHGPTAAGLKICKKISLAIFNLQPSLLKVQKKPNWIQDSPNKNSTIEHRTTKGQAHSVPSQLTTPSHHPPTTHSPPTTNPPTN